MWTIHRSWVKTGLIFPCSLLSPQLRGALIPIKSFLMRALEQHPDKYCSIPAQLIIVFDVYESVDWYIYSEYETLSCSLA